ncbi:MAG: Gfo/Idh/MocA family protein [Phycisphaerae bacterium]
MSESVRLALVGCGKFARRHCTNVCEKKLVPSVRIEAAVDLDADKAAEYARNFGIPRAEGDIDAVLQDDAIDGVMIVTEPASHVPLILRSLKAGKFVFSEKPLSASPEQRRLLQEALPDYPNRLLVGYCYRFAPAYAKARELVKPAAFSTALVLNHEQGGENYLIHNACHAVDAILSWHDSPVVQVTAQGSAVRGQANPAEQFALLLRFENGSLASITCGGSANGAHLPKWYYKTIGQNGEVAEVSMHPPGWGVWRQGQKEPETCSYYAGHVLELEHFAEMIGRGTPPAVTPQSAMAVDEVIAEARRQLGL